MTISFCTQFYFLIGIVEMLEKFISGIGCKIEYIVEIS